MTEKENIQEYAKLNTGARMPLFGLGTWKSPKGKVTEAVTTALNLGYKHIDCAACYGNEKEVGTALKKAIGDVCKREDIFITSKLWNNKHRKEDVMPALKKTLSDLELDYLDLYLIHWPVGFKAGDEMFPRDANGNMQYDLETKLTDTWAAMEECQKAGLVKNIGLSNFNKSQIAEICTSATIQPSVLQIESHPYMIQKPLIEFAKSKGIVVTAYSPLGSGDRPWAKEGDPKVLEDPQLKEIAEKLQKTVAQVAIRYQIQRGVVVIPKSTTPSRIEENLRVFDFQLSDNNMEMIESGNRKWRCCVPCIKFPDGSMRPRDVNHPYFPFKDEFPPTNVNNSVHLWIRHEVKPGEERVPITPEDAKKLINAGFKISLEKSPTRCIKAEEYEAVGCSLVEQESWPSAPANAIIFGLKELPENDDPLSHRHIMFAHVYKNQSGWEKTLSKWVTGNGLLWDLEFLHDDKGRRVAAFGRAAGIAGMALGLKHWCLRQLDKGLEPLKSWSSLEAAIADVKGELQKVKNLKGVDKVPTALVLGALGRCGGGACWFAEQVGVQPVKWDLEETKAGGPFKQLLEFDILLNAIYLSKKIPPFLTTEMLEEKSRSLSIIVDVSCDTSNPNNPLPMCTTNTTLSSPTLRIVKSEIPVDIITIDHLPSLIPRNSSTEFSEALTPTLLELTDTKYPVWKRCEELFHKKCSLIGKTVQDNKTPKTFAILGLGNPILDISANVSKEVLEKYDLKLDNAILAEEKHLPLYKELVTEHDPTYIPGGATLNSIRVAQWMLQTDGSTAYIGCIGKDKYGEQLAKGALDDGVSGQFLRDENTPTGTCAVLVNDKERSLVANLSAAEKYKDSHLDTCSLVWKNARIYYSAGFFLTVAPKSMMRIAQYAKEMGNLYCLNLSAEFLIQFFEKPMMELMPYVDILFGNETEAKAFGKHHKFEDTSIQAIALKIAKINKIGQNPRLVIITQGGDNVIVALEGKILEFPVPKVDNIVDTNGAGDAFVGGFLAAKSRGLELKKCVDAGIYTSGIILKVSGTKLEGVPEYKLEGASKHGEGSEGKATKKRRRSSRGQTMVSLAKENQETKVDEVKVKETGKKNDHLYEKLIAKVTDVEKTEKKEEENNETMENQVASPFGELPSGLEVTTPMGSGKITDPSRTADSIVTVQLPWAKVYAHSSSVKSIADEKVTTEKLKRKAEEISSQDTGEPKKKKTKESELPCGIKVTTPLGSGTVTAPSRATDNIVEVQLPWSKVYANSASVKSVVEKEKIQTGKLKRKAEEIDDNDTVEPKKKKGSTLDQSLSFLAGIKKKKWLEKTHVTTPFGDGIITTEEREEDGIIAVKLPWAKAYVKPEVIGEPISPLEKKILTQVEFYFSNSNLPVDNFLKNIVDQNQGWVSIELLASFKRMQSLGVDVPTVVTALRKSKELLEVDPDGKNVKRRLPLPANLDLNKSSIYAKPFPHGSSIESITAFFEKYMQPGHTVCCVRLRRHRGKGSHNFKGSIFIEFSSQKEAERITKLNITAHDGTPMVMMMKDAYIAKKDVEYTNIKKQRKQKEAKKREVVKDLIIKVSELEGTQATREWLKETIETAGGIVQYVDFSGGLPVAYLRLNEKTELKASAIVTKIGTIEKDSKKLRLESLAGDEESMYWEKVKRRQNDRRHGGKGGKRKNYSNRRNSNKRHRR